MAVMSLNEKYVQCIQLESWHRISAYYYCCCCYCYNCLMKNSIPQFFPLGQQGRGERTSC